MAQLVEHILGKDEVPGPNPGSSSRHPRRSKESRGFGFFRGVFSSPFCYVKRGDKAPLFLMGVGSCYHERGGLLREQKPGRMPRRRSSSSFDRRRRGYLRRIPGCRHPRRSKESRGFGFFRGVFSSLFCYVKRGDKAPL